MCHIFRGDRDTSDCRLIEIVINIIHNQRYNGMQYNAIDSRDEHSFIEARGVCKRFDTVEMEKKVH